MYFIEYHAVLMSLFLLLGVLTSLITETCLARAVCTDKYIFHFLSSQCCRRVAHLEWVFGGLDIFSLLIHMALGGFIRLRVVFVDILLGQ